MGLPSDTLECVPQKSEPDVRPTLNILAYQKTGVSRGSFVDACHAHMSFDTRREAREFVATLCCGGRGPHVPVVLHGSASYPYLWQGFLKFLHARVGHLRIAKAQRLQLCQPGQFFQPCVGEDTAVPPILRSLSRIVVSAQCFTLGGSAKRRRKRRLSDWHVEAPQHVSISSSRNGAGWCTFC